MRRSLLLSIATLALCFAGNAFARGADTDKVNGSIHVEIGQQVGKLSTVNGSIHIDAGAAAGKVSTVNGGITLGDRANADSLDTVNGGIVLDTHATIAKTIETVNGSIQLDKGADVAGRVSNVNGHITLDAAHVGGGIGTVSGDIDIGADSKVEGGILVDKSHSWFSGSERKPRIVIGPHAVVQGTLEFRREVDLFVSDSATIGSVTGATAKKFSGDHP
jgi:DUF4097 and DUF4098 domain-containing protein YvlB